MLEGASWGQSLVRNGEIKAREKQGHIQGHAASPCLQLSRHPAVPGKLLPWEDSEGSFPHRGPCSGRTGKGTGTLLWGGLRLLHSLQTLSNLGSHDQSCYPFSRLLKGPMAACPSSHCSDQPALPCPPHAHWPHSNLRGVSHAPSPLCRGECQGPALCPHLPCVLTTGVGGVS